MRMSGYTGWLQLDEKLGGFISGYKVLCVRSIRTHPTMMFLFITIIVLVLVLNAIIFLFRLLEKEITWLASYFVSKQPTFLILNLFCNEGFPKSACGNGNIRFLFGCNKNTEPSI